MSIKRGFSIDIVKKTQIFIAHGTILRYLWSNTPKMTFLATFEVVTIFY